MPWRSLFFAVNFGLAVLFLLANTAGTLAQAVRGTEPDTLTAGVCFAIPTVAVAIGEWMLFVRRRYALERPLGVVALISGLPVLAMGIFFLCNTAKLAAAKPGAPGPSYWSIFGVVCVMVGVYGALCCLLRFKMNRESDKPGFPVGGI